MGTVMIRSALAMAAICAIATMGTTQAAEDSRVPKLAQRLGIGEYMGCGETSESMTGIPAGYSIRFRVTEYGVGKPAADTAGEITGDGRKGAEFAWTKDVHYISGTNATAKGTEIETSSQALGGRTCIVSFAPDGQTARVAVRVTTSAMAKPVEQTLGGQRLKLPAKYTYDGVTDVTLQADRWTRVPYSGTGDFDRRVAIDAMLVTAK